MANDSAEGIEIRGCHGPGEMQACVELQQRAWGFSDMDCVPRRMFVVAEKIGGQVLGAWKGKRLAGFAMALPGVRDGKIFLHSHMVAVDSAYHRQGVGIRLKMAQKDDGIRRGFGWMEWTFDPVQSGNAYFNLQKLGAIARRYLPDHYGVMSSKLQAGLPSDRLVAEWTWMAPVRDLEIVERISIAAELAEWKQNASEMHMAIAEQQRIRGELESAFGRGLAAVGFERGESGGGDYLLARVDEVQS